VPSILFISASTLSHMRRIAAASSGAIDSPGACGMASNRSSWRRVRSMNDKPSAKVIVPVGSEKPITQGAGITPLFFANGWQVSGSAKYYRKRHSPAIEFGASDGPVMRAAVAVAVMKGAMKWGCWIG